MTTLVNFTFFLPGHKVLINVEASKEIAFLRALGQLPGIHKVSRNRHQLELELKEGVGEHDILEAIKVPGALGTDKPFETLKIIPRQPPPKHPTRP